jgi:hypothetical protein
MTSFRVIGGTTVIDLIARELRRQFYNRLLIATVGAHNLLQGQTGREARTRKDTALYNNDVHIYSARQQ